MAADVSYTCFPWDNTEGETVVFLYKHQAFDFVVVVVAQAM